ncbi:MAG: IclR family transcriptional regulator [Pseudomonadota bacterium]|jgi:DNA-binding IclR family transcriptional regulator|nr:IclR family transcriptional regulator [Pseudomonadota bacterium]
MIKTRPPQGAQAALRAIRLLKLFTSERPEMSLAEISRASGLNKTTTHRLLRALQSESLIDRNPATTAYSLGAGLMALGVQALASSDLRRRVRPVLRLLARETGETATLEVPFEDSMLILDEVAGNHVVGSAGNIGTRWPIHATSTGKAWLAFDESGQERLMDVLKPLTGSTLTDPAVLQLQLVEIRRRGYAVTIDEVEDGFTAVATIIRGVLGDVQGALSVGGPTQRLNAVRRAELGVKLCRAAQRLSPEF